LTITDTASRYLIKVRFTEPTYAGVRCALERVFCDVGLPAARRPDNGSPFGSTGAGGLSKLSVWWLKLGIEPHYIRPAKPQDNGRHERMHRTLKAETAATPSATIAKQQTRFDRFREAFNTERPHEALGQATPASRSSAPARSLPTRIDEPWYDASHEVRRVRPDGTIKWRGSTPFIGEALAGETLGLAALEAGGHVVRFLRRGLGRLAVDGDFFRFAPPRARLCSAPEATVDAGTSSE
jgi:hypothetical protein